MSEYTTTDWTKPKPIDDVLMVFPAHVVGTYLPEWEDIPEGYREGVEQEAALWHRLQRLWFFHGLDTETKFYLKDGVDGETALRHLRAVQGSFEPSHQHKEAGMAWLFSQWFEAVDYVSVDGKTRQWFAPDGVEKPEGDEDE